MGVLRLVLALWVAGAHAGTYLMRLLPDPTAAVFVFFAISGYLMALVLNRPDAHGVVPFYVSRTLRIYPLYLGVLGVTLLCWMFGLNTGYGFGPVGDPIANIRNLWPSAGVEARAIILFANVTTVGQDILRAAFYDKATGAFSTAPAADAIPGLSFNIMGQAWSIGPEMIFYICAPVLVRRGWAISAALAAYAILSFSSVAPRLDSAVQFLPFFLTGGAFFHISLRPIRIITAVAGLGLITRYTIHPLPGLGTVLVVGLIALIPLAVTLTRGSKIDGFLGQLSYPLYVTHFLLIQTCVQLAGSHYQIAVWASFALVATAVTIGVERPLDKFRHALAIRLDRNASNNRLSDRQSILSPRRVR
jgi:peptidoglycan/LPS O-acetylase OafA/YrhL